MAQSGISEDAVAIIFVVFVFEHTLAFSCTSIPSRISYITGKTHLNSQGVEVYQTIM